MSKPIKGSVCLNHPNVAAVARCGTCSKPICSECVVIFDGVNYCSELCRDNAIRTGMMVDDVQQRKARANRRRLLQQIISLLVILVLAYVAYAFYRANKSKIDKMARDATQTVQQKSSEAAETIKKSTVEKESKYKREREQMVQ